jgi:rSAM/selenodomain-associated transferase 2
VRIAVVIPTLQEEGRIAHAIESARAAGVEIIVADGGSRDATRERALAAGARVVSAEPGRARQLAAGAEAADADAILFLHADTLLSPGWADAVRGALADPAVVGGAFRFRFAEPGLLLRLVEWGVRARLALAGLPYGDQALFVRRSALSAIGGVPQAELMEDLDLVRALRRRGRLALLALPARTSARRYLAGGVLRTVAKNTLALCGWALGLDRARLAAWYRR